jgi:hypothetical protein
VHDAVQDVRVGAERLPQGMGGDGLGREAAGHDQLGVEQFLGRDRGLRLPGPGMVGVHGDVEPLAPQAVGQVVALEQRQLSLAEEDVDLPGLFRRLHLARAHLVEHDRDVREYLRGALQQVRDVPDGGARIGAEPDRAPDAAVPLVTHRLQP